MAPHYLSNTFRVAFEEYFGPNEQRTALDTLVDHINQVRDGSEAQRRELGVVREQDTTPEQIDRRVAAYIDKCQWQLAQLYRYSRPCRIAEAEPCLRDVIRYAEANPNDKKDVTPSLYLAVALHQVPGKEDEALALFTDAFTAIETSETPPGPRSELWARAHCAGLLRRMEKVADAEVQEKIIVDWITSHPSVLPPQKLQALVEGEAQSGALNGILNNPDVVAAFQRAREGADKS